MATSSPFRHPVITRLHACAVLAGFTGIRIYLKHFLGPLHLRVREGSFLVLRYCVELLYGFSTSKAGETSHTHSNVHAHAHTPHEHSMVATVTKLGEGAFAEVFGCRNGGKDKLALKVRQIKVIPVQF